MKNFKPILFSSEMVNAILEDRKTQTRRVIKSRHESGLFQVAKNPEGKVTSIDSLDWDESVLDQANDIQPKFYKGDVMWVRETFRKAHHYGFDYEFFQYKDGSTNTHCEIIDKDQILHDDKWKPSIFMPKEACRIFLEVTNVRVERLQDLSEEDAIAEGVKKHSDYGSTGYKLYTDPEAAYTDIDAIWSFESLWESINGKDSWNQNPWVWVYDFKRIAKPESFLTENPQPTIENR